jgi:hypothetical protein
VEGNEAEAETSNETEPNTGLCEVFVTYTFIPYYLQRQFVNGILGRTTFYFWFFVFFLSLCFSPFPLTPVMQSNASILKTCCHLIQSGVTHASTSVLRIILAYSSGNVFTYTLLINFPVFIHICLK